MSLPHSRRGRVWHAFGPRKRKLMVKPKAGTTKLPVLLVSAFQQILTRSQFIRKVETANAVAFTFIGFVAMPARVFSVATLVAAYSVPLALAGQQPASQLNIPVDYYKLGNGLKVVLSRDTTAPTAVVAVYYNIGFRNEPRNRTGFAHLFEHLMFQGSQNLGKMQFIRLVEQNGGILNGSTRFDFTNYYQVVPSNALETILWGEADRMHGLAIDSSNLKNQQEVVKNEVRVNVMNQPYGSFPWIDMPMRAADDRRPSDGAPPP